jgi:hypothetical protein
LTSIFTSTASDGVENAASTVEIKIAKRNQGLIFDRLRMIV